MRTLMITVVLLLAVAVGAGFYFQWLNVSRTDDRAEGQTKIELRVNKTKFKEDMQAVREKAGEVAEDVKEGTAKAVNKAREGVAEVADDVKEAADRDAVSGELAEVNAPASLAVRTADGATVTVRLDADTTIRRGDGRATAAELRVGDRVTVAYRTDGDERVARTVTVTSPKAGS